MSFVVVTGGAGYIGAHCCVELIKDGWLPVIFDNMSNSFLDVINRIETITSIRPDIINGDIRDSDSLDALFARYEVSAVIHLAALKAVGESTCQPLRYFDNNVCGSIVLLRAMAKAGVTRFIYSSSATVYGASELLPLKEDSRLQANNPYGRSKLHVEEILEDVSLADPNWAIARLRYFNPVGAHESGIIGEDPKGVPNNLMPYLSQVALGARDFLPVFGGDYPTCDGTGVRDYIHVVDLAEGHVAALNVIHRKKGLLTVNLGTGRGHSVLELIAAFESVSGCKVPYKIVERRPGDVAECWADPSLAQRLLEWRAKRDLQQMCRDSWRWQITNPDGYRSATA